MVLEHTQKLRQQHTMISSEKPKLRKRSQKSSQKFWSQSAAILHGVGGRSWEALGCWAFATGLSSLSENIQHIPVRSLEQNETEIASLVGFAYLIFFFWSNGLCW